MLHLRDSLKLASEILGVDIGATKQEIQYGYYCKMLQYHPDRNGGDLQANRLAALINEAKNVLLGKDANPTLLKDQELIADLMKRPVSDDEVLSYEEWLKKRFYHMEQCSVWPC